MLQAGFVVHPELNGIHLREDLDKTMERAFGVGGEVLRGDAEDQAGHALTRVLRGPGNAAALHAAR